MGAMKRWLIPIGAVLLLVSGVAISQVRPGTDAEQTRFSFGDAIVQKPVAIPEEILPVLGQDEFVRGLMGFAELPADQVQASWFSASAIHLSGPNERERDESDLIVVGHDSYYETKAVLFWVFCRTAQGYELALKTPARDFQVKDAMWQGHREIETTLEEDGKVTSTLYRWDGKHYTRVQ